MLKVRGLTYIILLITILSCGNEKTGEKIKQGKVIYEIEYLKKSNNLLVQNLLPNSIDFIFIKINFIIRMNQRMV